MACWRVSVPWVILVAVLAPAAHSVASAEDATPAIRDAASLILRDAQSLAIGERPLKVVMRETLKYYPADDNVLRRLAERVARHPEHPDKGKLELWQRHRSGQFTMFDHEVYMGGDGLIRVATNRPSRGDSSATVGQSFTDLAIGPDGTSWTLTPSVLISDEKTSVAPAIGKIDGILNMAIYGLGRAFDTDVANTAPITVRDGRAYMNLSNASQTAEVTWIFDRASNQQWQLSEVSLPQSVVEIAQDMWPVRIIYQEHDDFGMLPWRLSSRSLVVAKDGQIDREFSIQSVEAASHSEVRALVKIPSSSRPDPIRGWSGQEVASTATATEESKANRDHPEAPPQGATSAWAIGAMAVGIVGSLVLAIVILRHIGVIN